MQILRAVYEVVKKKTDVPFDPPQWPATHVEMRKLDRIIPYDNNPRTHPPAQIELLAADMKVNGVTMPILVDEDGVIIAGHGRRLAAEKNGYREYPVVVARGWTDEQKRAARIRDNQIGLLSVWDNQLIASEIGSLKLVGFDVGLLGFPESQLRGWGIVAGNVTGADPEAAPERPKKPVTRPGDVWLLGDHRLTCGDSTSPEVVAIALDGKRPHLMATDPPYGVNYDPNWRNEPEKLNLKSATAFAKKPRRSGAF